MKSSIACFVAAVSKFCKKIESLKGQLVFNHW